MIFEAGGQVEAAAGGEVVQEGEDKGVPGAGSFPAMVALVDGLPGGGGGGQIVQENRRSV